MQTRFGITLNQQGDTPPWGTREYNVFTAVQDLLGQGPDYPGVTASNLRTYDMLFGNGDSRPAYLGMGMETTAQQPVSLIELYDTDEHPVLTITAAHATDFDPQIHFRDGAVGAETVQFATGWDAGNDRFVMTPTAAGVGDETHWNMSNVGLIGVNRAAGTYRFGVEDGSNIPGFFHQSALGGGVATCAFDQDDEDEELWDLMTSDLAGGSGTFSSDQIGVIVGAIKVRAPNAAGAMTDYRIRLYTDAGP
jgi:hypothetical protein